MPEDQLSISIRGNIQLSLTPKHPSLSPDSSSPVYAINWFNTKSAWLYRFYNLLAVRKVLKVGARPYIKASVADVIRGDNELRRDVLLIVRYPKPGSFLQLLESKYFQAISIFRRMSVSRFSFAFAGKTSTMKWQKNDPTHFYCMHIYQSDERLSERLINLAGNSKTKDVVEVFFAGETERTLTVKKGDDKETQVPNVVDGLIIYQAKDRGDLLNFVSKEDYWSASEVHMSKSLIVSLTRAF